MRTAIIMPVGTIVGTVTSILPVQTFTDSITDLFISGTVTVNVIRASANPMKYDALDVGSAQRMIKQINNVISGIAGDGVIVDTASPAVPTGVSGTAAVLQSDLSWDYVSPADSYKIYRASVSGGPYTLVATSTTDYYNDPGLTAGITYFYVITGFANGIESAHSAEVSVTPQSASFAFSSVSPSVFHVVAPVGAIAGTGFTSAINLLRIGSGVLYTGDIYTPVAVSPTEIDFTGTNPLVSGTYPIYYSTDGGINWTDTGLTIDCTT